MGGTALDRQLDAERDVARLAGGQYAVDLDIGLVWDIGAPLPHLLASERRTFLVFYLSDTPPGWDGRWVEVVSPAAEHAVPLGVAEFVGVHSVKFGGPNDEAIKGHPLHGRGLKPYAAHTVVNSPWITAQEQINSVHPLHRGGWHHRLNHYLVCFHDSTFECLAREVRVQHRVASPRQVLQNLTNDLLD
ncbi:MAG TPA: hypothetical protein VK585_03415 [Jiangellaceae bacterium]|nr:hypothetical protein [Jiangellaceae bacterium]